MKVCYTKAQEKKGRKIKNDLNRRHRGQEFMDHGKLR